MADSYEGVVGGKLSLKKTKQLKAVGEKKKKKRKHSKREKIEEEVERGQIVPDAEAKEKVKDFRTEAQKKYDKEMEKRKKRRIDQFTEKSYREKVEEFNYKVASLPEHNDVPKVAAAGLG